MVIDGFSKFVMKSYDVTEFSNSDVNEKLHRRYGIVTRTTATA